MVGRLSSLWEDVNPCSVARTNRNATGRGVGWQELLNHGSVRSQAMACHVVLSAPVLVAFEGHSRPDFCRVSSNTVELGSATAQQAQLALLELCASFSGV
jgi:hypothetical protein